MGIRFEADMDEYRQAIQKVTDRLGLEQFAKVANSNKAIQERKEKNHMRVTLANGLVLEGTVDQVVASAKALGFPVGEDGTFYMSSTRGLIRIKDMESQHIRNAISKRARIYADGLRTLDTTQFVKAVTTRLNDATTVGLINEYVNRRMRGVI